MNVRPVTEPVDDKIAGNEKLVSRKRNRVRWVSSSKSS